MYIIDINRWNRKEHFEFFKDYSQPFFGITTDIDVTIAYQKSKKSNFSFFLYYLHKSLVAINSLEPFRYRITEDGEIVVYDVIRAGATINRPDGTFSFSYIPFHKDYGDFEKGAKPIIEEVRATKGLPYTDRSQDVAYFSAIPWIKFTSIEHATNNRVIDSVPKIAFGKWEEKDGLKRMPVSVHVHHALMDGLHVGEFYSLFQKLLNE